MNSFFYSCFSIEFEAKFFCNNVLNVVKLTHWKIYQDFLWLYGLKIKYRSRNGSLKLDYGKKKKNYYKLFLKNLLEYAGTQPLTYWFKLVHLI